jgi:hypothetical protein
MMARMRAGDFSLEARARIDIERNDREKQNHSILWGV